jgi:hypothetical protein
VSSISTVIDALRTRIPALTGFSTKTEIPNAYSLGDNPEPLLENGWGIRFGEGIPSTIDDYQHLNISRQMTAILTALIFRTEEDPAAFATASKNLFESALILARDLAGPAQFNNEQYVLKVDFQRDSGLSFIKGNSFSLLYVEIGFAVDIAELW